MNNCVAHGVSGLSATEQEARTAIRKAKYNILEGKMPGQRIQDRHKELIPELGTEAPRRLLAGFSVASFAGA